MIHTPIESLLKRMVAFKTTVDAPAEKERCLDWIEDTFFHDRADQVQRGEVHNCPYLYKQHPRSKLLLFGHIDVVPAEDSQFTAHIRGNKVWGRGSKDMKGAVLTMLIAYRNLVDAGKAPAASILLTSDEEIMGKTIPHLLKENIITDPAAYTPDNATPADIIVKQKGSVCAELIASGKAAHSARPWNGNNAIALLIKALDAIAERFPAQTKESWTTTVEPTVLSGGEASNKIPGEARCKLSIRYVPEEYPSPTSVLRAIRSILPSGCRLECVSKANAFKADETNSVIQRFQKVAESVLKQKVALNHSHGASDARHFSERGIPAFLYGPTGGGLHAEGEWVHLSSLLDHININTKVLKSL